MLVLHLIFFFYFFTIIVYFEMWLICVEHSLANWHEFDGPHSHLVVLARFLACSA